MELNEFYAAFIEEIRNNSIIEGQTPAYTFLTEMMSRLEGMDYIIDPTLLSFYKSGTNQKIMKFDLFAFDETDKSLILLINDYVDDDEMTSLIQTDINQHVQKMINYLEEVNNETIYKFLEPSQDVFSLSRLIRTKLSVTYTSVENSDVIDRIKLFIITNKKLSKRVANQKLSEFAGRQVELNIWDVERIYDIVKSGKEKEPIFIDFASTSYGKGIPVLKANFCENEEYDAYLGMMPGNVLSEIYYDHGSRLLEGNVRAFLSTRGKINKGIRDTILKEPGKFFTYNNGIACTAKSVTLDRDGSILVAEDLQIINGGQTTASLTSAKMKDKAILERVFVPMKLTIVKGADYDDMVTKISRYANSQNKVTDADFFSNHPFHRRMEALSDSCVAPGQLHSTYWFYERSRGKYEQAQFKMLKESEKTKFSQKYPKSQLIKKEELAKYFMAGMFMRPEWVSKGSAKNMTEFAKVIDEEWEKDNSRFNNEFYKKAVCYTIIFRSIDKIVGNAEWYHAGGYKLNIVPYTIAKIFSSLPDGYTVDFKRIWEKQRLYDSFVELAGRVAKMTNDFITKSNGVIVTEHAKKTETWKTYKSLPLKLNPQFIEDLVSAKFIADQENAANKEEMRNMKLNAELEVINLSLSEEGMYWNRLYNEGLKRGLLSEIEASILNTLYSRKVTQFSMKMPSPKQADILWRLRSKLEDDGVIV